MHACNNLCSAGGKCQKIAIYIFQFLPLTYGLPELHHKNLQG